MSSTAVINKTRSYFSTLLSRGVPSFTPPADAEPLLPFARPPPPSHDVITVYTDGSYFEGQIGIGIASTDPRIARTFSSRMGTAFPLTPDIVLGAVASPATTFLLFAAYRCYLAVPIRDRGWIPCRSTRCVRCRSYCSGRGSSGYSRRLLTPYHLRQPSSRRPSRTSPYASHGAPPSLP
jgi:hypothetical protein